MRSELKKQRPQINSITRFLNTNVPVSGVTSWKYASHSIDLSGWEYVMIKCGAHGAIYNTIIIPVPLLKKTSEVIEVCSYWDSGNLGSVRIDKNGGVTVNAKTQSMTFDYTIYKIV